MEQLSSLYAEIARKLSGKHLGVVETSDSDVLAARRYPGNDFGTKTGGQTRLPHGSNQRPGCRPVPSQLEVEYQGPCGTVVLPCGDQVVHSGDHDFWG